MSPKLKILIAEDHAVNQEVIKAILVQHGHEISVVDNGLEAIEILAKENFDIILMDMQMPVMDGCQATREIRKREMNSGRRIRIIAITANAVKGDREICRAAGMDDYITKPIDADMLIAKLIASGGQQGSAVGPELNLMRFENRLDLNPDVLKGQVFTQTRLSTNIMQMFLKDLPGSLADLEQAYMDNDIGQVAKLAHRLGGVAAMLGAEQMAAVAEQIEVDASVGATRELADLIEKMYIASIPLKEKLLHHILKH